MENQTRTNNHSPRVLHVGAHAQLSGGYRDLVIRVNARRKMIEGGLDIVTFLDSPECAQHARKELNTPVENYCVLGSGEVSVDDLIAGFPRLLSYIIEIRTVVGKENIDIIHANSFRSALICSLASKFINCKFITHIHHDLIFKQHPWLKKLIFSECDEIIHVSDYTLRELADQRQKHHLTRSPLDIERLENTESDARAVEDEFGLAESPVVSLIGRVSKEKGHLSYINAAKRISQSHPEAVFLIVGTGDEGYKNQLLEKIEDLGISDRVLFTGFWEDITEVYRATDIVVVPSYDDNLPKVIQEALVFHCAVVASDSGGIPELIIPDQTGLLVPEDDQGEELADAVTYLLSHPAERKKMAEAGKNLLKEEYTTRTVTDEIERIYKRALK